MCFEIREPVYKKPLVLLSTLGKLVAWNKKLHCKDIWKLSAQESQIQDLLTGGEGLCSSVLQSMI
jgi:hypothetical protein